METYQQQRFMEAGINAHFVQDNHSGSTQGTLRGLHFQIRQPQGKLLRVVTGEIFDVAVDLRRSSPTFGKWVGTYLSSENKRQIWVPVGFAHGFYVLSEWVELLYKTTDFYAPAHERSLRWDDPSIGVNWPLLAGENLPEAPGGTRQPASMPIVSARDMQGLTLQELEKRGEIFA